MHYCKQITPLWLYLTVGGYQSKDVAITYIESCHEKPSADMTLVKFFLENKTSKAHTYVQHTYYIYGRKVLDFKLSNILPGSVILVKLELHVYPIKYT